MALAYLIGFFTHPLGPSSRMVDAGIFPSPLPQSPGETERRALMEAVEGASFEQARELFFKKLEDSYPNRLEGLKRCATFQRQFTEFKSS